MNAATTAPTWTCGISWIGCQLVLQNGYWKIMPPPPPPIEMVIHEIERALEHRLYYLAIMIALTLPDVCSALETPDGRANDGLYRRWYKKHLKQRFGALSPSDCWSLRCGVVHQGRMGVKNQKFSRVIFTTPETSVRITNCIINDALVYDAELFCLEVIRAVREWYDQAKEQPNVKANLPNLVHFRPHGLLPYIAGQPIIS